MSTKKSNKKPPAKKKPVVKEVKAKADKLEEAVNELINESGTVMPNNVQDAIVQAALQQSASLTALSAVFYRALEAPESPIYNLVAGQMQLQQLIAGLIHNKYVDIDKFNQMSKQYNDLYAAYQQVKAQAEQLQSQNQALTAALHGRTVNQTQMIGV